MAMMNAGREVSGYSKRSQILRRVELDGRGLSS